MRLIDADALSEKLCETTIFIKDGEVFQRMINDAPTVSAEAVQGWIPVSERLPENNGCMLVTIDDAIEFGKYEDGEWSIWVCEHWDEWDAKGVTAWMPLPEPYEGGDSE